MAYYENDIEAETEKISKINAAGLINITFTNLWNDFYRHLRGSRFAEANADLDCLWVEFGGDVEEGAVEETTYDNLNEKLVKKGSLKKRKHEGFKKINEEDIDGMTYQYTHLLKKALFLKKLQNKQGKGTAYRDSADDYMDD